MPVTLILLSLMLGLVLLRLAPPSPKPANAPPGEFSAGRAHAILASLARDGAPHPVGSPAQTRVRQRLAAEIRRLGYSVREERDFVCSEHGSCTAVQNLVVELPGREPDAAVLLAAHYDSIAAGPGVSDNLAGVAAVLEVARVLKGEPRPRNSVLLLFNEGEEAGLLGARSFLETSPQAKRVKAAVNLEARGTSGPSLMFETSRVNAWLIELFARSVPHPRTSSVFQMLYEYLPNDTDFTLFKRHGLSGFNFAYIGDPAHYHTPLDNLANTSRGSLQHHGENALATVRALANADLDLPYRGQAVFFDFLGTLVFRWPASWGVFLAGIPLVLVAATALQLRRRGLVTGRGIVGGLLAWWTVLVVTAAAGFALSFLLRLVGGLSTPWPAYSLPGQAAFWLLALAVAVIVARWFRRAGFFGLWIGGWLMWTLLGLATALFLPGASYLLIFPGWVAGLAGLFLPRGNDGVRVAAAIVPALVAGAIWFPLLILLYGGLGSPVLWLLAVLLAVVLTALLPLGASPDRGVQLPLAAGSLVAALAFAIAAAALPAFTPDSPRRLNFTFHQDATGPGQARWLVITPPQPPLPPSVSRAASFGRPAPPFPWSSPVIRAYAAPAPVQPFPAPSLTVVRDETVQGKRRLALHLSSPRGAPTALLFVPEEARLEAASVAGERIVIRRGWRGSFWSFQVLGLPPGGVDLDVVLGETAPQVWYLLDRTAGLPPVGTLLLQARPTWVVPGYDGDVTLVSRKIVL